MARTLELDGRLVSAREGETILQVAGQVGIAIPTLCHFEGLSEAGACRLCLVEVAGLSRLQPACLTVVTEGMVVRTATPKLVEYRRQILELLLAERNHVCAVCVADGSCDLQSTAREAGVDHVRYDYLSPSCSLDLSHGLFGLDHNRCILCARCVRVCDEVEGAHTWDVAGRGTDARVVIDLNEPWGQSSTCTSCGKCVNSCPTGALFHQGMGVGEDAKDRSRLVRLLSHRSKP